MSEDHNAGAPQQPGEIETFEKTTRLTLCCEVEPAVGLAETKCPDCGRFDPRTIRRVTVERRVVRD